MAEPKPGGDPNPRDVDARPVWAGQVPSAPAPGEVDSRPALLHDGTFPLVQLERFAQIAQQEHVPEGWPPIACRATSEGPPYDERASLAVVRLRRSGLKRETVEVARDVDTSGDGAHCCERT